MHAETTNATIIIGRKEVISPVPRFDCENLNMRVHVHSSVQGDNTCMLFSSYACG
jgi:hypothetical protein